MLRSARISALSENRNAEVIAAEQRVGRKRADERRCRSAFACERFRKLSNYPDLLRSDDPAELASSRDRPRRFDHRPARMSFRPGLYSMNLVCRRRNILFWRPSSQ